MWREAPGMIPMSDQARAAVSTEEDRRSVEG
jgi:hypothetical protein